MKVNIEIAAMRRRIKRLKDDEPNLQQRIVNLSEEAKASRCVYIATDCAKKKSA